MRRYHLIAVSLLCLIGSGCTDLGTASVSKARPHIKETASLSKSQQCAIGYDLARQVYTLVEVNKTAIRLSPKLGGCGTHAARYLRKAGYAVDETASKPSAHLFSIGTFEDKDTGSVFATAYLPGLRVTRAYSRGEDGVYPLSPVDVTYEEQF